MAMRIVALCTALCVAEALVPPHGFAGQAAATKDSFADRSFVLRAASEDDEDPELAAMRARMESLFAMPAAPESEPIIAEEPPVAAPPGLFADILLENIGFPIKNRVDENPAASQM